MVPELIKALKTHHLRDVAWGMLGLHAVGAVCWFIYGAYRSDIPLAISGGLNAVLGFTLIILKYHYDKTEKPMLPKDAKAEALSKAE